jgi:hypothetical protein
MAGFSTNNEVSFKDASSRVVFTLKSSAGKEIKTYTVPPENADAFEASMRQEEPKIRQEAGETDPLMLIRIDRCF